MLKMNSAKSYKILILLIATVMMFVTAFSLMNSKSAYAEGQNVVYRPSFVSVYDGQDNKLSNKAEYFKVTGEDNDVVKISVEQGNVVKLENQLVLAQGKTAGDLNIKLSIPSGMTLKLNVIATALDPNGSKKVDGETVTFDKEIKSTFTLNTSNQDVVLGLQDNIVTLNGNKVSEDLYYQVNAVADKVAVNLEFVVEAVGTEKSFNIESVNQYATATNANDYNQTFEIDDAGALTKTALPRVMLPKGAYAKTENGYVLRKVDGEGYDFNYGAVAIKGYRLIGGVISAENFKLKAGANKNDYSITFSVENNSKFITFNLEDRFVGEKMSFSIAWINKGEEKDVETFNVDVIPVTAKEGVTPDSDKNNAPVVDNSASTMALLDSYQNALENRAIQTGTNHSVPLGKSFNIPSMDAFFLDDNASYNDLIRKYYYITPTTTVTQPSTTTMKLEVAGTYKVYGLSSENTADGTLEMDSNFFYDVKEDKYLLKDGETFTEVKKFVNGTTTLTQEYQDALNENKYFIYMFTFEIQDDAPIKAIANNQDDGFVGVTYKVQKFNVSDNTTATYKLFYNANVNAKESDTGWVEIISKDNIPEEGANGYTFDELTSIGFDSSLLTFTPDKVGAYKLQCEVASKVQSGKSQMANVIIKVSGEPTTVEVPNYWFRDNLASIIFLGVGTLCLIGIIILLVIKPKDDIDAEIVDVTKNKKNKSTK